MKVPKTDKNNIKHPKLAEAGVIPKLGSSLLFIATTGGGKTVLMENLLGEKEFYKGFFDKIFVVSPTAECDDIIKALKIPKNQVFTDMEEAVDALSMIHKHQEEEISKHGNAKAKQYAIVLDDCIGDHNLMTSSPLLKSFIASRHYNLTTFLASQHLRKIPKPARLQAKFVALFPNNAAETDTMCEEYCPPFMHKKQFKKMLEDVWNSEEYQFLSIHRGEPMATRYRRGLAMVINLRDYLDGKEEKEEVDNINKKVSEIKNAKVSQIRSGTAGKRSAPTQIPILETAEGQIKRQTRPAGIFIEKGHNRGISDS